MSQGYRCKSGIDSGYNKCFVEEPIVETAEEATEPAEADINELCTEMFNKMAIYLTGELTATSEDYKLLENMNKLTNAALQPYLEQINQIEEQVAALEQAAYKLDAYSKKLVISHVVHSSFKEVSSQQL
ncbi:Biogenesis of lysosome-related organelles complex 1 subunit 2, partial [Ophiophagus hannah]